jgi:hypothetical protein
MVMESHARHKHSSLFFTKLLTILLRQFLDATTLFLKTLDITTLSITLLSTTTLSIAIKNAIPSIMKTGDISFMLSVAFYIAVPSVVMLSVFTFSVVVPILGINGP